MMEGGLILVVATSIWSTSASSTTTVTSGPRRLRSETLIGPAVGLVGLPWNRAGSRRPLRLVSLTWRCVGKPWILVTLWRHRGLNLHRRDRWRAAEHRSWPGSKSLSVMNCLIGLMGHRKADPTWPLARVIPRVLWVAIHGRFLAPSDWYSN